MRAGRLKKAARVFLAPRLIASPRVIRDEALKVLLQNPLDSPLFAFMWGFGRHWLVRVD
jgi:hypothetical protein